MKKSLLFVLIVLLVVLTVGSSVSFAEEVYPKATKENTEIQEFV